MIKNIKKIIGFLYSIVFCTAIVVGMPQIVKAAEEIDINETNFPDAIFKEYVSSEFDKDSNGSLSEEEITKATNIYVYDKEIKNLKGIEYFTNLISLECSNNQLTSLDVSKNTYLQVLWCDFNQLTKLDISKNTALTELVCRVNQLTELDVNKNTALTSLSCYENPLTKLDISHNTALEDLCCSSNQLTELNLSNNTALKRLQCFSNQLQKLDLSKNTNLEILECHYNQLTELDLSYNGALYYLNCSFNQLNQLDVSHNTVLDDLYCLSNQLTELDLSDNTALQYLECGFNQLTQLKLNSQIYDKLLLYKGFLHGCMQGASVSLSDLQNITEIAMNEDDDENYWDAVSLLKVIDITKPATYKVNGKVFTIIYTDKVLTPSPSSTPPVTPITPSPAPTSSASPVVSSDIHIFNDYNYSNPVTGSAVEIYGNGVTKIINGKKVSNKEFTVYTDITASYKYTPNSNGTLKPSIGKVIVGVTTSSDKPTVSSKNKITDISASNIAKAKIKNGQITVTAVGKESGFVYLWVIDTGNKGISACCPIDVKLAPKKLEIQSKTGSKLTKTKLANGNTLEVCVSGIVSGSAKTEDCTYTATVDLKYQGYITVTPVEDSKNQFIIKAINIKNSKNTKVAITFKCDQNMKKTNFSLTITK